MARRLVLPVTFSPDQPLWLSVFGVVSLLPFWFAALPSAWATLRKGSSVGIPVSLPLAIITGCLLAWLYIVAAGAFTVGVTIGLFVEISGYLVVVWYHFFPRERR